MPSTAFKVSGPDAGPSFVLGFCGTPARAAQHADEALLVLREGAGQWTPLEMKVGSADGVALRSQRPLAKVFSRSDGTAEVLRSKFELEASGLDKAVLVGDLARLLPQGVAEPEWSW